MNFPFYDDLSREDKSKYDLMLETSFAFTMCDELRFVETDEKGHKSLSSSFLPSIKKAKVLWGMGNSSYPQGSISANRNNYEVIRNYFGGIYPDVYEFTLFREGVLNFLRLRRDDSSPTKSWLFGSSYSPVTSTSGKALRNYRAVEVSLRHTATSLWILLEEFQGGKGLKPLKRSIDAFLNRANGFLKKNEDWHDDVFQHLTIAAISKCCDAIISKLESEVGTVKKAKSTKKKSLQLLFDGEHCEYSLDGTVSWNKPDAKEQGIAIYENFLDLFALCMIPAELDNHYSQQIVRKIINNRVPSSEGYGIPIQPMVTDENLEDLNPDFGSSAGVLYLLWFSLEHGVGDEDWQLYCKENFLWLLDFCISAFDKKKYYLLPYTEHTSKILLLPRFNLKPQRESVVMEFIFQIKREIYREIKDENGKLQKNIDAIKAPVGLEHVAKLISLWQVPEHFKNSTKWFSEINFEPYSDLAGQFVGGVIKSFMK